MSEATGKCRARLLSDPTAKTECDQIATSLDGRFCAFHSRQCQGKLVASELPKRVTHRLKTGLYRGYKRRNAQLDDLAASRPPFLANTEVSLVNQTFQSVTDKVTLDSLFQYLFRRYNLLDRVIRGRKLHHTHFFAVDHDYGHEKYVRQLLNEKQIIAKALERLGKQISHVLYKEKSWASWVKERQEEDENSQENESRKVKLEAQLFRRHQKEIARRQRELRKKEKQQLQDVVLEQAYAQKMSELSGEAQDEWDPIQDVVDDDQKNYKALIEYFLMLKDDGDAMDVDPVEETPESATTEKEPAAPKSKSAKKRAKKAKASNNASGTENVDGKQSGTIEMETRSQIRNRLQKGVEYARKSGYHILGALENPPETYKKSAPIPDEEIDTLIEEIAEVKLLLFCRLLLSHASLLPLAIEANSVQDFLDNVEVTTEGLRDLCLKVERPSLQDVRDACADFVRAEAGENEEDSDDDADMQVAEYEEKPRIPEKYEMSFLKPDKAIPKVYKTKREQALAKEQEQKRKLLEGIALQLPELETEEKGKRVRIKVCGRYISHYPSEKALPRGGWYHFCLIAKDSELHDAIQLCRNWNEFFELSTLCLYHYFPASKWTVWVGDQERLQLLRMVRGLFPYVSGD